jgi:hypothetical protein
MAGEMDGFEKVAVVASGEDRTNERSTIAFPYSDLETAMEVARALYARTGRGPCELDGLAASLNQTVSGAFRLKTGAAKVFGLTDKEGRDAARLTPLGIRIVSPDEERAAKADAFLNVPLYSAVFDRYRGGLLPPAKALEREMVTLGVSPKVADRARQVFERSARQSGFFDSGENRLIRPKVEQSAHATNAQDPLPEKGRSDDVRGSEKSGSGGGGGDSADGKLHPFIEGLLKTLPETGSTWTIKDRAKWLKLAANAFDLIYEGDGEIEIKAVIDAA